MKRWTLSLVGCWAALAVSAADSDKKGGLEWFTDLPTAQAKAKKEDKTVLLDFTGSDWCPPCIRLKKEVLSKSEFAEYAQRNLVLVEVDFPRHKKLSAAQQKANDALAEKYNPEGSVPTIVLLDKDGKLLGKTGYMPGGPKTFLAELEKIKKS